MPILSVFATLVAKIRRTEDTPPNYHEDSNRSMLSKAYTAIAESFTQQEPRWDDTDSTDSMPSLAPEVGTPPKPQERGSSSKLSKVVNAIVESLTKPEPKWDEEDSTESIPSLGQELVAVQEASPQPWTTVLTLVALTFGCVAVGRIVLQRR